MRKIIAFVGWFLLLFFLATPAFKAQSLQLPASILCIESLPSNASLILDSNVIGKTPITLHVTEGSSHKIRLQKPGYLPFQIEIASMPNDSILINAILEKFSASIAVITENKEATIEIDGRALGVGTVDSILLEPGTHEVSIFDPIRGNELNSSFQIEQTKHYTLKAEYRVPSTSRLIWSFLLPGYAQLSDNNQSKGILFALTAFGAVGYSLSEYFTFVSVEKSYKFALDAYDHAFTDKDVEQTKNVADRKESEYKVMRNRYGISLGVLAAIWLGNALDVTLNHFLSDRINVIANGTSLKKTNGGGSDFQLSFAYRIP